MGYKENQMALEIKLNWHHFIGVFVYCSSFAALWFAHLDGPSFAVITGSVIGSLFVSHAIGERRNGQ